MATWKKWTSTVLVNGQPEPNVKVYVYEPGTTNEIPIYEDEGVTQITQPILTDSQGRYAFFVDVETYPEIRLYLEKDGVDFSEVNEDLDGVPVPGAVGEVSMGFTDLTDTPSDYSGSGGQVVKVKTAEDGLEFGQVDHGELSGLSDDDHPQYLLADGSRPLSGDLDFQGHLAEVIGKLNFKDATTLTISSGAITVSQSYHFVDTEGEAASDDLGTINGGTAGDILYLRSADSSRTVVIKHGTGNIVTPDGTDYSLDSTDKVVALLCDGANWHLVGAAGGGEGTSTFLGLTDTPSSYAGYAKYSPMVKDDETGLDWQSFADMELESRTIYVDADNGSDTTGDGSEGNPFQTYEKALSTVRNVIADGVTVTIHLKAATATYTPVTTGRLCIGSGKLLVKGELTSLVETTCTGGTATTIVKSGAGWTENAYQRKLVKFTKGGTDYWRIIESNTSDTLTVIGRLDVTPSSGDSFVIYDWASKFAGNLMDLVSGVTEFEDCAFQVPIMLSAPNCVVTLTRCQVIPSESYDQPSVIRQFSDLCFLTLETCVLLRNSVTYQAVRFRDYASGFFKIYRSFLGGSPAASSWVVNATGAGVGCRISNGTIIDGAGSGDGIRLERGAIGLCYSATVNGATDKITIRNCSDYGVYADAAAGITHIGTGYVNYSSNGTDYAANSSLYAWYKEA